MRYLLDASALLNLIKTFGEKVPNVVKDSSIMDLTIYEVGNGVWRLVYLLKEINYDEGLKLLKAVAGLCSQLNVTGLDETLFKVYDVAFQEGLTFYDACYIISAKKAALALVTDDIQLASKAKKYVSVLSSKSFSA
jgi:predicted nucleic acid-binding protein